MRLGCYATTRLKTLSFEPRLCRSGAQSMIGPAVSHDKAGPARLRKVAALGELTAAAAWCKRKDALRVFG